MKFLVIVIAVLATAAAAPQGAEKSVKCEDKNIMCPGYKDRCDSDEAIKRDCHLTCGTCTADTAAAAGSGEREKCENQSDKTSKCEYAEGKEGSSCTCMEIVLPTKVVGTKIRCNAKKPCAGANTVCKTYRCKCDEENGFFDLGFKGTHCLPHSKLPLGNRCDYKPKGPFQGTQCADKNSMCKGYGCNCKPGYNNKKTATGNQCVESKYYKPKQSE